MFGSDAATSGSAVAQAEVTVAVLRADVSWRSVDDLADERVRRRHGSPDPNPSGA